MRFKVTTELCYFAGLSKGNREVDRSRMGFKTTYDQLAELFVQKAIALGVQPQKMMIEQQENYTHIYFYHSKLSRMIREILDMREGLQKKGIDLAVAYAAGLFDSSGHVANGKVYIRRMEKRDELLLEFIGVHTSGGRIVNPKHFLELISGMSFLAKGLLAKKNS